MRLSVSVLFAIQLRSAVRSSEYVITAYQQRGSSCLLLIVSLCCVLQLRIVFASRFQGDFLGENM